MKYNKVYLEPRIEGYHLILSSPCAADGISGLLPQSEEDSSVTLDRIFLGFKRPLNGYKEVPFSIKGLMKHLIASAWNLQFTFV